MRIRLEVAYSRLDTVLRTVYTLGSEKNIDAYLIRWAMGKYKRLRGRKRRAAALLERIRREGRILFVHWSAGFSR